MSDFLSQFEDDSYKRNKSSEEKANKRKSVSDVKEIVVDIEGNAGIERAIDAVNHDTVIDTKYNKRKIVLYVSVAVTIIAVALIIMLSIRASNRVSIIDFVGNNVNEVRTWALRNRIELEIEFEFSLEADSDIVISQDRETGERLQRGDILKLTVSRGADPDERVEIPDFEEMTLAQMQIWINTYRLRNVHIMMEYNEEIERNRFIRKEFRRDTINETNFIRREAMTIYVSRGEEVAQRNILVPDFASRSRTEVEGWATENGVSLRFAESGSDRVPEGFIISQNVAPGTRIANTEPITLTVSLGSGVRVPDFSTISKNDAANAVAGLQINVRRQYSETVQYGRLISQSVRAGTVLFRDDASVQVVYSIGRPYLENLVGTSERELPALFYGFLSRGANITYSVIHVDSPDTRGSIVWASRGAEFMGMTEHVYVHVSRGNLTAEGED